MKFFAPLVTLVLFSLSSTEAAFRGAASSSNNDESPSRALRAPEFFSLCDAVETRKKCKKQASGVPCTKCKWDKDTNTCTLGPVKKKKCKKDKRCAWTGNKGDKTCTEKPPKPPKLCDSYNKRKKCIKKTVDGIPCEWVDNGCYLDVS